METIRQQMLQQYEILVRKEVKIVNELKELEHHKRRVVLEMNGTKQYLQTVFYDRAVKARFQEINELRKELSSKSKTTQKAVESKTHIVIRILQEHGQQGLDTDEIISFMPSNGAEIDRSYLTTILGKLRKRGMAIKEGKKFFITAPRQNPATALRLVKNSQPASTELGPLST